ncbi:MAG: carbohydrate binding domain-containing protein [Pirellulales bacterium]|nr:carbohydrate binding domain-containing protein [Pirellulales bacterium]
MKLLLLATVLASVFCGVCIAELLDGANGPTENLIQNGDFEKGTEGWEPLWAREMGAAEADLDTADRHEGDQALRIGHRGQKDWSLGHSLHLKVVPGDILELSCWVRVRGEGSATLGVVARDNAGKVMNWAHGARRTSQTKGWLLLRSRFLIPPAVATIWPRLIGDGPATVWCDDFTLTRQGNIAELRRRDIPASVTIGNAATEVTFRTGDATFAVRDHRSGRTWIQSSRGYSPVTLDAKSNARTMDLKLLDPLSMREIAVRVWLDGDAPELIVALDSDGEMDAPLAWPAPFTSAKGQLLILPVNEGISYPADDASLPEMHYHLYGGHGLCMPWYGAMDGGAGWMAIVATADDAAVSLPRHDGLLFLAPEWEPQKRRFGPQRVIRYVVFNDGGYVAMTKRYREYTRKTGLLIKTLAEKRQAVPAVDLLVGAVNIWCWDRDAVAWCRELQAAGIQRILWSNALPPDQIRSLNDLGVLTSRYDIYQDAMNPENFPRLRGIHSGWTSEAWKNDDLMIGADGQWIRGWEVEAKDGTRIPCGTLCDRQAVAYAKRRIPSDLATHPYRCRFIDTTTASPWRECWHPKHPMTRTESKQFKMDLLAYVSDGCGLVCGSETGHDAAVPFVHYFEGMLSLGPYRVPDAGRNMMRVWNEVPELVAKFQTGHVYRLPLWELVYHDCVVAQWYWGDYNNKLPPLWDRRDLWNVLYGTPPMFMLDRKIWTANKERFVISYQTVSPVARACGYSEMLSHEWLTLDHAVQQTRFSNGVTVTVNFGDTTYKMPDGTHLPPLAHRAEGLGTP